MHTYTWHTGSCTSSALKPSGSKEFLTLMCRRTAGSGEVLLVFLERTHFINMWKSLWKYRRESHQAAALWEVAHHCSRLAHKNNLRDIRKADAESLFLLPICYLHTN
ncbi:unnamed protein product [Rangifer tarandus platyrhynchus]|uniref:Uncharacterized protein n=1 Tax=Rangifer tarandus platyrhynchus TaxID=3082113 RepID=A0AC59Z7K5_RANTA